MWHAGVFCTKSNDKKLQIECIQLFFNDVRSICLYLVMTFYFNEEQSVISSKLHSSNELSLNSIYM
jgi:hypothetical protein